MGILPKSVLYRVLLQRGMFTQLQLAPTTFYRMVRDNNLLDEKSVQKHRLSPFFYRSNVMTQVWSSVRWQGG